MKITLIGYGKMGHIIERIALSRGHEIVARIDIDNHDDIYSQAFASADMAIEFTTPSTAEANCLEAISQGVGVVCGSTGWTAALGAVQQAARDKGVSYMWSSNFSIGVNIFMALNRFLAKAMNRFPQYTPYMEEVHHIHKLDHPSGTAVTLAEGIIESSDRVNAWVQDAPAAEGDLIVSHIRRGEVPGIHTITWDSPVDDITITHSAKSREGFALGAVMAAEWLAQNPGVHTIDEMMADMMK